MVEVSDPLSRYIAFMEAFTERDLDRLETYFTDDARFCDPFNDVRGIGRIRAVFAEMLASCDNPRLKVMARYSGHGSYGGGAAHMLKWRFYLAPKRMGGSGWWVTGTSEITLAADGRVQEHIDYWDAAEGFYRHLPVIGAILGWIARRLKV